LIFHCDPVGAREVEAPREDPQQLRLPESVRPSTQFAAGKLFDQHGRRVYKDVDDPIAERILGRPATETEAPAARALPSARWCCSAPSTAVEFVELRLDSRDDPRHTGVIGFRRSE
jgi:hypothetical protein